MRQKFTSWTQNMLPIAESLLDAHYRDYYFFMSIMRNCAAFQSNDWYSGGTSSNTTFLLSSAYGKPEHLKLSKGFNKTWRETFSDGIKVAYELRDEYVAFAPPQLWDTFIQYLDGKRSNELNSFCRLYFYLYLKISANQSRLSIAHIATDLGASEKDVSRRIILLERGGWICRSNYNPDLGLSRYYTFGLNTLNLLQ